MDPTRPCGRSFPARRKFTAGAWRRHCRARFVAGLLASRDLRVDRAENVIQALRVYQRGKVDFADTLIERLSAEAGCEYTLTFDIQAAKAGGMKLIA